MSKKSSFFRNLRITYNAPVTLTFSILCVVILVANAFLKGTLIPAVFTAPGNNACKVVFDIHNPLDYARILLHVFGHADWNHLISNLSFILLLGPVIEERYGSPVLALMMTVTSLVTGVLNVCFSPMQMMGSSDIAFMMILLTSFTTISKSEVPLSFILIIVLYIGRELVGHPAEQNIATFAHIAGGLCGSMFAFLATPRTHVRKNSSASKKNSRQPDYVYGADERDSPRFKKSRSAAEDDNSTVVGTLEL